MFSMTYNRNVTRKKNKLNTKSYRSRCLLKRKHDKKQGSLKEECEEQQINTFLHFPLIKLENKKPICNVAQSLTWKILPYNKLLQMMLIYHNVEYERQKTVSGFFSGLNYFCLNLNLLHPRMFCANICWNRLCGSGKDLLDYINVFLLFCFCFPLKKSLGLHLTKHEYPSSIEAVCQVWLQLPQWFWRRFLKLIEVFSLLRWYLPLKKGHNRVFFVFVFFYQICIPFTQGCVLPNLVSSVSPLRLRYCCIITIGKRFGPSFK